MSSSIYTNRDELRRTLQDCTGTGTVQCLLQKFPQQRLYVREQIRGAQVRALSCLCAVQYSTVEATYLLPQFWFNISLTLSLRLH